MSQDPWSCFRGPGHLVLTRGEGEGYVEEAIGQIEAAQHLPSIDYVCLAHPNLFMNDEIVAALAYLVVSTFQERSWDQIVFAQAVKASTMPELTMKVVSVTLEQTNRLMALRGFIASRLEVKPDQFEMEAKMGVSGPREGVPAVCAVQSDELSLKITRAAAE